MSFFIVEVSPSGRAFAWSRETLGDLWDVAGNVADRRGVPLDDVDLASPSSIIGFLAGENFVRWAESDTAEHAATVVMRECERMRGHAGQKARAAVRALFPDI